MNQAPLATHYRQAGFVLTIELILITTILIIGSFVGISAVRNALVKQQVAQQDRTITVSDSNGVKLGKMLSLNEHETPIIPFIDNSVAPLAPDPAHQNYRALLGVRDDRFTSREPVYYDAPNCTGNPCIKGTSDETSDSVGVDGINGTGAVSYFHALQGGPNYAIGRSNNNVTGYLFRSTPQQCPVNISQIESRYLSQKVISGMPCESFSVEQAEADVSCLVGVESGSSIINIGPTIDNPVCDQCPAGTEAQGDTLDRNRSAIEPLINTVFSTLSLTGLVPNVDVTLGEVCCPIGTRLDENNDLTSSVTYIALATAFDLLNVNLIDNPLVSNLLASLGIQQGTLNCVADINLLSAEQVVDPFNDNQNVLQRFTPPFKVNLPSVSNEDSWIYVAPDGEGVNSGL
ncbi:hypothetical protein [Shewanella ulleungensis]|jgi:hypothetical protein|uniref:Type II secretion system protein n=1 Tax=Shewanella ulleungensis TaxID=2282699 RepID=A0ABQ2QDE8_9GAMM|nr:hypothetical protein [Shewanella ulleungensis]MCL1148744.1 hypothetical protein [Shewanella ulleungensis]GGP75892.1 hypothetical protein GCM10009410_05190 [Shewanella ulleungensis]